MSFEAIPVEVASSTYHTPEDISSMTAQQVKVNLSAGPTSRDPRLSTIHVNKRFDDAEREEEHYESCETTGSAAAGPKRTSILKSDRTSEQAGRRTVPVIAKERDIPADIRKIDGRRISGRTSDNAPSSSCITSKRDSQLRLSPGNAGDTIPPAQLIRSPKKQDSMLTNSSAATSSNGRRRSDPRHQDEVVSVVSESASVNSAESIEICSVASTKTSAHLLSNASSAALDVVSVRSETTSMHSGSLATCVESSDGTGITRIANEGSRSESQANCWEQGKLQMDESEDRLRHLCRTSRDDQCVCDL